jgi:uroporphyrinogen-III decarboxylase
MNSIEKIKRMVNTSSPSEIPIIPFMSIWAAKFFGIDYDKIIQNPKYIANAHIKAFETINCDALYTYCDIVYLAEAFGCRIRITPSGAVIESPLQINELKDIDKLYVPNVKGDGRLPIILEATKIVASYAKGSVPVVGLIEGPFTTVSRLLDVENLMRKIRKNRLLVEKIL